MNSNITWIFLLIMHLVHVTPRPLEENIEGPDTGRELPHRSSFTYDDPSKSDNEKVISVRITSSVAIGRGKLKPSQLTSPSITSTTETFYNNEDSKKQMPTKLEGANIEYIKQLHAKKDGKDVNLDQIHPYQVRHHRYNDTELSDEDTDEYVTKVDNEYRYVDTIPTSDNIPASSQDVNFYKGVGEFLEPSLLHEALKYSKERSNATDTDELLAIKVESQKAADITSPATNIDEAFFNHNVTDNDDSIAALSTKADIEISDKNNENYENLENVPLARSVLQSPSSNNIIQGFTDKPPREREHTRLTTVSFNIVHDAPKSQTIDFSNTMKSLSDSNRTFGRQQKFYDPPKVYSQPSQIYSEPSKIYSEPAKIYSVPAKIYSEPAKIYGEPAKIYSEPAKFYSEPASLHLTPNDNLNNSPWRHSPATSSTNMFNTTPLNTITIPGLSVTPRIPEHQPEKNYEIDEKVSVLTHGRSHGIQESTTEKCKQESCKVGYVVKGRQYNKYRVEERTSDGFIVGEYGVVRNEDGVLRGVRYTADGDASPRLIHDALMKFLQL